MLFFVHRRVSGNPTSRESRARARELYMGSAKRASSKFHKREHSERRSYSLPHVHTRLTHIRIRISAFSHSRMRITRVTLYYVTCMFAVASSLLLIVQPVLGCSRRPIFPSLPPSRPSEGCFC